VGPSLSLNFARSKTLDPRITFSRASSSGDATYMNGNELIVTAAADEPRFDHKIENGVVKSLGLLVEEQRTNLTTYSTDFSSGYTAQNGSITTNQTISPSGENNAALLTQTSTSTAYLDRSFSWTSGTKYTFSCYVKKYSASDENDIYILGYNTTFNSSGSSGDNSVVIFNLDDLTSTTAAGDVDGHSIIDAGNGWRRISATFTAYATETKSAQLLRFTDPNQTSYMYMWGYQLEVGAFPTSYIPTTSSTKTRSADNVSMTGTNFSDWYNPSESTFLVSFRQIYDASSTVPPSTKHILQAGNDTTVNDNYTIRSGQTSTNWSSLVRSASPSSLQFPGIVGFGYLNSSTLYKAALSVNSSLISVSLNGLLNADITNTTTVNHTTPFNKLFIGSGTGGLPPYELSGHISQLAYYPKRLTNTQLQNLTK
jgi:hypothetical protein